MRASGVLLPVSALPSAYGIGSFSKEAYEFVDQLREAGQRYWQILPLGPTSYGDSPYQSFSTFAGNPYFIDLEELTERGWLTKSACGKAKLGSRPDRVDYAKQYENRYRLLREAFVNSRIGEEKDYQLFLEEEKAWLDDYALFLALKKENGGGSFLGWRGPLRRREREVLSRAEKELDEEIRFQKFLQYLFYRQWERLKSYANDRGIRIIGDIPIYVALDSADVWVHPELFRLDEEGLPLAVAGCPPDAFAATGQLWGNPLYDWPAHERSGFAWWVQRVRHSMKLYDMVRIDHFRGFDAYYAVPYGDPTAERGHWEQGPGFGLFERLRQELGELPILAENLGFLTDSVQKLLEDTGYPGMKVLEFAFDAPGDNPYQPHNYPQNCVVYTGTHDNETLKDWYAKLPAECKEFAVSYMGSRGIPEELVYREFIRLAMSSVADICIIPMQDYLGLGTEARMNIPSVLGGNWEWRLVKGQFTRELQEEMHRLAGLYGRA